MRRPSCPGCRGRPPAGWVPAAPPRTLRSSEALGLGTVPTRRPASYPTVSTWFGRTPRPHLPPTVGTRCACRVRGLRTRALSQPPPTPLPRPPHPPAPGARRQYPRALTLGLGGELLPGLGLRAQPLPIPSRSAQPPPEEPFLVPPLEKPFLLAGHCASAPDLSRGRDATPCPHLH